jgi:Zn-dependent protease with chaperone function
MKCRAQTCKAVMPNGGPRLNLETDAVERIHFYIYCWRVQVAAILAPLAFGVLLSLVMLLVAIAQDRCWLFESISDFNTAVAVLATIGILLLFAGIVFAQVRRRVRLNLKDFYRETEYDQGEYESFKSALEGVCIGMGMSAPGLAVLGIPTINTIAFREKGKPGVGVTAEALRAGLTLSEKEAMMAHEMAHIALGDYFLASSSAGFEYAGYGLGLLFLLMAVLVTVAVNVYLLFFLLPLFVPLLVVLADSRLRKKSKTLYRHNDLLADTVAAKLTSDPESLRKTIEKLWALSEETRAVVPKTAHFQGYVFVSRPLEAGPVKMVTYAGEAAAQQAGNTTRATKIYWVPGKTETESGTSRAYEAVQNRIVNLKAIELGQWTELAKPEVREKVRSTLALAAAIVIMVAIVLALIVPWNGNTAWSTVTTNVIWKQAGE